MEYVDFAAIKKTITIETAMIYLSLKLEADNGTYRGACPKCKQGGSRALVITPDKNAFYCHAKKSGGDVISLVAHLHGTPMKEAASWLLDRSTQSVKEEEPKTEKTDYPALSKILDDLVHDHPQVQAMGLTVDDASRLDIGYKARGLYRGEVVAPIRTEDGQTVSVFPLPKDIKFPKVLHFAAANVVPLKARRA